VTLTTPAGRQPTARLDAQGHLVQVTAPGLSPVQFAYDSHGRLVSLTQADRTSTFTYDGQGFLAQVTDPLAQTLRFGRDAVGRATDITRPDGEHVLFAYDADGNAVSVTPPGRPAHGFTFTPVDLLSEYIPPSVASGVSETTYDYN